MVQCSQRVHKQILCYTAASVFPTGAQTVILFSLPIKVSIFLSGGHTLLYITITYVTQIHPMLHCLLQSPQRKHKKIVAVFSLPSMVLICLMGGHINTIITIIYVKLAYSFSILTLKPASEQLFACPLLNKSIYL